MPHKNIQKRKEYAKEYRILEWKKIRDYKSQIICCPCGCKTSNNNRAKHLKTDKHKRFENMLLFSQLPFCD